MMVMPRKYLYVIIFFLPLAGILSQCYNINTKSDPRGNAYAGSAACVKCHQNIYSSYLATAHYKASQIASVHTIHGSFAGHANTFFINKNLKIVMEMHRDGFYQTAYQNNRKIESERFDFVFGGVKGESYVYWKGDEPFQLPLSYFNQPDSWSTSPGYHTGKADYSRAIKRRCFECHASFIKDISPQTDALQAPVAFDRSSLVLSIDCERCHGPLANHVDFHTANPNEKKARFVVGYQSLSRAQKLDVCAVCHSGNKSTMFGSTFAFKPGDTLAHFELPDFTEKSANPSNLDVHGNQLQLLASSKCFIKSQMDCSSCHNTHVNERGNLMLFAQRCMNCHTTGNHNFCKMEGSITDAALKMNCIKCHMPEQSSKAITVQTLANGSAYSIPVTTHHIAVYPQESAKIMAYLKSTDKRSIAQ